jgi:porphobilinogen deaminase
VGAGKKSKMRKDRYSALIMANMAARRLQRLPTPQEYKFYGGFAGQGAYKVEKSNDPFSGPNWFTDGVKDIY